MTITLPAAVAPNELIQSAWGNAVVNALDELDTEKLDLAGGTVTGEVLFNRSGTSYCVTVEQDPLGGHGSTLRADGALVTSITGTGGSTIATPNIAIGRGGAAANDTAVYVTFRSDTSTSTNPQGTLRGSISVNGSGGGAVAYNTSSDERIKTDVGLGAGDGLATVERIIVHRYLLDGADAESVGVFAQELAEVLPQAVTVGGDDPLAEPWQVGYSDSNIIGHLLLAVQQLQARVAVLEAG